MPLTIGSRVGPYEVVGPLGAGGMGEVYRARDAALHRDVALKILAPAFADNPERLARFEREAQVLASLNHPHIAQIYGLERQEGRETFRALILELVEGPTLADRIEQGPIPLDESLAIARQIAEALEAAHEQGIVHRDLKPANVKVRPDGTVKVLDFGLAKALEATTSGPSSVSMSPTLTAATQVGLILGTAAYMAPEQARGKAVDKRADIWAFGAVLYEMLSGRRAFAGEEVSDTLAYVITKEIEWSALPADTPAHIRRLLRRCLDKDPKRRLRDIGEARVELEASRSRDEAGVTAAATAPPTSTGRRALPLVAGLFAGSVLASAITWTVTRPAPIALRPVQRFPITLPSAIRYVGENGGQIAISPDGTRMVFPAIEGGKRQLYIRNIDQLQPQPVRGTDDAFNPFFSTSGEWIAYFTNPGSPQGKLKKVAIRGGPALTLADAAIPTGTWTRDDTIIFASGVQTWSLYRVAAAGGAATRLTTPVDKEARHAYPEMLPDGRNVLFTIGGNVENFEQARIAVLSLDTGKYRTVIEQGHHARYLPSGHIVYALAGNLMAVPFDTKRLETLGPPVPIVEGVRGRIITGQVAYGVSPTGFLVYAPGSASNQARRTLVWVDRAGKEEPIPVPPRAYAYPRISPDGTQIALDVRDQDLDIWIWDVNRRGLTRLTFDPGADSNPVWSADGKRVIFAFSNATMSNVFWQAADGTGRPERLYESAAGQTPLSVSPDGTRLLIRQTSDAKTGNDLFVLPLTGERRAMPLLQTPFSEQNGEISPDGRWIAYQSNESGNNEIYVRPFPNVDSGRWQVSVSGGTRPLWSRDGRELFYMAGPDNQPRVMVASISTAGAFSGSAPRVLLEGPYLASSTQGTFGRTYDVSPDGKRFLMIKDLPDDSTTPADVPLVAVLNLFDELKRLAPSKR